MRRLCIEKVAILGAAVWLWQPAATAQGLQHADPGTELRHEFFTEPASRSTLATELLTADQVVLLASATSAVAAQAQAFDCAWPADVIAQFHRSVERGELVLFGRTLEWREVKPMRIEYAYELASRARTVSVHVDLITAVPVPEHETMVVRSVAAAMAQDGGIIESRIYVVPR